MYQSNKLYILNFHNVIHQIYSIKKNRDDSQNSECRKNKMQENVSNERRVAWELEHTTPIGRQGRQTH